MLIIRGTHELAFSHVKKVIGKSTDVFVDGYDSIGEGAFIGTSIETLRIGKSVVGINDNAFHNITSLTNVIFEEGSKLTNIGYRAFYNTSLVNIFLPENITVIFDEAFAKCKSLHKVTLSGLNLSYIGNNAFYNTSLETNDKNVIWLQIK